MTDGFFKGSRNLDPAALKAGLSATLTPRDRAMNLLRHTLLDQQLDAIKAVLRNHEAEREGTGYQFEVLDSDPRWDGEHDGGLEARRDAAFWRLTFQASAHSMSAVGMLAPFIESLFVAIFDGLKTRAEIPPDHLRQKLREKDRWNPQVYQGSNGARTDLLKGIAQLSKATGLAPHLPPQTGMTLEALIRYRNNMLHNGFEWPDGKVDGFAAEVSKWPEGWFEVAESDGKPWLYYMSPGFCTQCVALTDGIIDGVGRYRKERGS